MLIARAAWKPGSDGRQSMVVCCTDNVLHALPPSGPGVSVFVFPLASHVPGRHFGHGEAVLPVMYTREERFRLTSDSPVDTSTVPLASAWITFRTQVVSAWNGAGLGIGSGGPK